MGAAASVQSLYKDALEWLVTYIDKETYIEDFAFLDKDTSGGLSHIEFKNWIVENAKKHPNSCWSVFLTSPVVLSVAHKAAAAHNDSTSTAESKYIVDISEFRSLLIHLYATSILWRHFSGISHLYNGDTVVEDVNKIKLDHEQFTLAIRSFCSAHMKEELTDDEITSDFLLLDSNYSGEVSFVEVSYVSIIY